MMLRTYWKCLQAVITFRGYKPQPVTHASFMRWIGQFDPETKPLVLSLLDSVIYLNESKVQRILLGLNHTLLNRLEQERVPAKKVIYVQIDDAGSSSPVVLNLLRNKAQLEKRGCKLIDSRDVLGFHKLTKELSEGAIVYVDDFVGTGDQFSLVRSSLADVIVGPFAEFLLAPSICEEGLVKLGDIGIEPVVGYVHTKVQRPLHDYSQDLDQGARQQLREMCSSINSNCYYGGLGYKRLAGMVVLYSNAPDTLPSLFRGSPDQHPLSGIFPRFSDLPLPELP